MTASISDISQELYTALVDKKTLIPITTEFPNFSIDDAYEVSKQFLAKRINNGEKVIGKKIGVTSKVVQEMLGVHQPDFGFLTDAMQVKNGSQVDLASLIQPRAEAEIAFILSESLNGPGITRDDVISATSAIVPCFEIVDSRINNWEIKIQDTIADNASCGIFCLSEAYVDPKKFDLALLEATVFKNGNQISSGLGSAVQGHPAEAVAWLANTLGNYGISLDEGDIILSGSLVPLEPIISGDQFSMEIAGIGRCDLNFV
jgi:2-oxopent-4-enoate/cis-2-oxohex-4-enoate hydratase